jgi:pimeloyl-ACP methyl ester carboxylesterase
VKKKMIKIILWIVLSYIGYCALIFLVQRQLMFPSYMIETPLEVRESPGLEKIWLNTEKGNIETWFFSPDPESVKGPSPVVIFAHGNGELIDFWHDEFKKFTTFGIGLMLVEYPGYGRSTGKASPENITKAFVTAYDYLASRKEVDPNRIILMGRSMGGGAVCQLATKRPSVALILMSTFTSTRTFAPRYFVPKFLVRDTFDNLSVVKAYPGPMLLFHGKYDEVVPYQHSIELAQAGKNAKLISYFCGHNDCPPDYNIFWKDIELFLNQTVGLNPPRRSSDKGFQTPWKSG